MDKYGISLIPNILHNSTKIIPFKFLKTKMDKSGQFYEEHNNEMLIQADMEWIWVDNENPENRIVIPWILVGQQGDLSQSFGSALTYSSRYFMLKYFNVATSEDDPEAFYLKKKEAEKLEETMLLRTTLDSVHGFVEKYMAKNPDGRDELLKLVKKFIKTGNYYGIKDVEVAKQLLAELNKKFGHKEEEK